MRRTATTTRSSWHGGRAWWAFFGLFTVAGVSWMLAVPLMTGPDEVAQARRAAAVVRGELTGARLPGAMNLVVVVEVPEAYGETADAQWRCHLGPLVDASPQEGMVIADGDCPAFEGGSRLEPSPTVQYRGQPFFYAWAGLPTLASPGASGAYSMRLLALLPATALLASAATSVRAAPTRRRGGLGLLACTTPAVIYLTSVTNPAAVEIAAALSAWTTGMLLASDPSTSRRIVARFGVALVVLAAARGLGPLFAGLVIVTIGALAGRDGVRTLLGRSDVRRWSGAVGVATLASVAWLVWLQATYPLPDRAGSGWVEAAGYLPWYLHQSIGVFGTNDSEVGWWATGLWLAATVAVVADGLRRTTSARRVAASALLAGGLAVQVTAEGLSLPPIGFFWQGRYALPVLFGGVVVATMAAERDRRASPGPSTWASVVLAGVFCIVHVAAFVAVADHHRLQGSAGTWSPTAPFPLLLATYMLAVSALGALVVRPRRDLE